MHPILVFLAVIAGSELAGIVGLIFAIPALAMMRVVYDFLGARLRTRDRRRSPAAAAPPTPGRSGTADPDPRPELPIPPGAPPAPVPR